VAAHEAHHDSKLEDGPDLGPMLSF
jgi:hypothetical protein